jgi:hypothetical protein
MIFAREVSDNLTSLVKKIDAATGENKKSRMGSFVVFCSDDEGLEKQLKALVEKENIKNTVLSIVNNPAGPPRYKVAKDADITVVLYDRQTVKFNHAYRKGQLTAQAVNAVVNELPKILKAD